MSTQQHDQLWNAGTTDVQQLNSGGIRKTAVGFLWLSLPGDYRVTDEALLAETT